MLENLDMLLFQMLSRVEIAMFSGMAKIITLRKASSNIGGDKSFVDDLNTERSIVSVRVAFVPRSAEIQLPF